MKKYIVTYTMDFGEHFFTREVESESYTAAYIAVNYMIPITAAITNIQPA